MKSRKAIQTILYLAIVAAFFVFGCGQSNPISPEVRLDDGVVDYTLVRPSTYDPGEKERKAGTDAGSAELVRNPAYR